jgi:PAS domain S-box-containing protein
MVSFGRVDAMVGDMATATHYLQKEGITNLRVAGQTKYYTYLSFASRNDWPELNGILEKALASITPGEGAVIMDRWIGLKHKPFIGSTKFWAILLAVFAGICLIFAFIVAWNRSLKRLVNRRTKELSIELFERKQAEERYRDLFENANVLIQRVAPDGRFEQVNKKWLDTLGYTKEELPQLTIWDIIHPASMDHCKSSFETIFSGNPIENMEVMYITKDGRPIPVEGTVSCHYVDGEIVSTRSIFRDITDRKRADAERKNLEAQLQRAQKMEAIGTLAGGVAHDLNNVLSGVVSYPDLILMQLPPDSPYRKSILKVKESGLKAAAIVQDLLTLARRGAADKAVVNLNQIILDYLDSPEFEKLKEFHPNVNINTKLETNLFNIYGSGIHLSKTVMNLVSNAAEAIENQGQVLISTQNLYIEVPIAGYDKITEGDYVLLVVSDTGVGISQEDKDQIFDPFFTKKRMGRSGTGLGMAVVWGTVKDHNGYIDVRSGAEKGTQLMLYFPISRKQLADSTAKPSIDGYRGRGESILVVDDVKSQREIAKMMLTQLGYSVVSASSGENAVAYLQTHQADVLLLDMIMDPGMDGLETYRQVLKKHPHQTAIIASGYSETDRVKEAQRLGASQYIKKPYTLERLGMAVRNELDK